MLAIELVSDPVTRAPSRELAQAVRAAALERGLLLITCGVNGNCIRVLVPLVIADPELDEALGVWEEALEAVLG
jgi:4-aminobutyrate aminotransferase/(S)-3-amino-2-methylpropionate transaminase